MTMHIPEHEIPRCPINGKAMFETKEHALEWIERLRRRYELGEMDWDRPWGLPTGAYKCQLCMSWHTTVSKNVGGKMARGIGKKRRNDHG